MNWHTVQGWFAESALVRRASEAALRAAGRRHLAQLAQVAPARCQRRILFGLLHQAQTTRFGRDHDFRRIRTIADYRRLVPLCTRAELWRDYWQPVYPHLAGATWPAATTKARITNDGPPSLSLRALSACHRSALRTAFALIAEARPHKRLLSGTLLLLGDDGPSSRTERDLLVERLPALLRTYSVPSVEMKAERLVQLPVTSLIGPAERLLLLFEQIKQVRGKRCIRDIWPQLSVILYTRRQSAAPASQLRSQAGDDVLLLEMIGRAEGPIAIEDPQLGLSRLLFDHGVYFEFVPPELAGEPRCPRLGIEEIELGVPYELTLSSPAGLWACRLGRTVCFERRDPPLLRFIEPVPTAEMPRRTRRTDLVLPTPALVEPHPQNADSPAGLPESSSHSPWSILVDRG